MMQTVIPAHWYVVVKIYLIILSLFCSLIGAYYLFGFHFTLNGDALYETVSKYEMVKQRITKGELPLWEPYEGGGVSFMFQGSRDLVSMFLLRWMPAKDYVIVTGFFYICFGLFTMFVFLKELKCSDYASFIGSIIWGFSGFSLTGSADLMQGLLLALIPFGMLCTEKMIIQGKREWVFPFIIATSIQLTTGRWEFVQYSFTIYAVWIIASIWGRNDNLLL